MEDFDLRRLQLTELQMLKDFAKYCDDHEIVYFLNSGTLLGAIRHQGFIPWDDDIDVCMDTENYYKFLKTVKREKISDKYFIQNYKTDKKVPCRWTRIRINGTTSMPRNRNDLEMHCGICMDVFVMIGARESKAGIKFQRAVASFQEMLLTKWSNISRGIIVSTKRKIIYLLPECIRLGLVSLCEHLLVVDTHSKKMCFHCCYNDPSYERDRVPSNYYTKENRVKVQFEDGYFWAPKEYVKCLEAGYGEWKKLPPENQRNGHYENMIVDFENDYTKYLK